MDPRRKYTIMIDCYQKLDIPNNQFLNLLIILLGYPVSYGKYESDRILIAFTDEDHLDLVTGYKFKNQISMEDDERWLNMWVNKDKFEVVQNYVIKNF